jgi:hypothetical protein
MVHILSSLLQLSEVNVGRTGEANAQHKCQLPCSEDFEDAHLVWFGMLFPLSCSCLGWQVGCIAQWECIQLVARNLRKVEIQISICKKF